MADARAIEMFRETCTWEGDSSAPGRDPVALIAAQSRDRLPELVPLRYERMAASPFAFFRGAALPMAADLATLRVSGIEVQLAGDAHIGNFGIFASPSRRLVFDLNDFDETLRGPWEWDVLRLAASVEICARERGFSRKERRACVRGCADQYRRAIREFARMGTLDLWYARFDVEDAVADYSDLLKKNQSKTLQRAIEKARSKTSARAAEKLCEKVHGRLRIVSDPPQVRRLSECADFSDPEAVYKALEQLFGSYVESLPAAQRSLLSQYRLEDIGQKVVGVGSVGLRCWIAVLSGRDVDDPLVLQIKEARPAALEHVLPDTGPEHEGERVVEGQRLMQSASDILLGWAAVTSDVPGIGPREYYVRQMWDSKGSIDLETIGSAGLEKTARLAAWTLARAHARTGCRASLCEYTDAVGRDAFRDCLCGFAEAYADQNERDYRAFCHVRASGSL